MQTQIEYYFGLDNLIKDLFLRQIMSHEGWVPIDLVAGFKWIQLLTPDVSVVKDAINNSSMFEVNPPSINFRLSTDWKKWLSLLASAKNNPLSASASVFVFSTMVDSGQPSTVSEVLDATHVLDASEEIAYKWNVTNVNCVIVATSAPRA